MNPIQCGQTFLNMYAGARRIKALQDRRLRITMQHAARVPFYRERFAAAGVNPGDIRTAGDLGQIPITTRAEVQSVPLTDRLCDGADETTMYNRLTSGSTGHPLRVLLPNASQAINNFLTLRSCTRYGLMPWHRKMNTCTRKKTPILPNIGERFGLYRRNWLETLRPLDHWVDQIREYRPHCIMGFLSSLRVLAYHLLDAGITDLRPRFVITIGEATDPATHNAIERAFSAPTYDLYGSWEGGMMAWECPRCEGYHINADWVIVELLENGVPVQPGEEGDVVITNLHNHGMPFIRYAQGDRAVRYSGTPCRRHAGLPLLKQISGRTTDMLIGLDGFPIPALAILCFISDIQGIKLWRLIQETRQSMRLQVRADTPLSDAVITQLSAQLSEVMMGEIKLQIDYMPDLETHYSQKFHRVICNVEART
jgi:phenylacetate-CoA ligase